MEIYEEWDMTIPALPTRSRLYRLEPIGIGTPYIESLTSYITRIAVLHNISTPNLIMFLFKKNNDGREDKDYAYFNKNFLSKLRPLNGSGIIPEKWVNILQQATSYNQLSSLTMLTWKNVITNEKLLRLRKAWCPQCYSDWKQQQQVIYEPLIWMLDSVNICGKHRQQLISNCPVCQKTISFQANCWRPGVCPFCSSFLGNYPDSQIAQRKFTDINENIYDIWIFESVGELLAAAPTLEGSLSREAFSCKLKEHLPSFGRNIRILEGAANISRSSIQRFINESRAPFLDNFLRICYALSITPIDLYLGNKKHADNKLHSILGNLPASPRKISGKKMKNIEDEDIDYIRMVLETILNAINTPPFPSLGEIARLIGYSVPTIRRYCLELSSQITTRSRKRLHADDLARIKKILEEALNSEPPISLKRIAMQVGCSEETLRMRLPALCDALVSRYLGRFDNNVIRCELQEILNSSDLVPSLSDIAQQLGVTRELIRRRFPELYESIVTRRSEEKEQIRRNVLIENSQKIREAIMVFHQKGIYPSTNRVTDYLGNSFIFMEKTARDVWKVNMKDLGYFDSK